jgi:hypothetical protein
MGFECRMEIATKKLFEITQPLHEPVIGGDIEAKEWQALFVAVGTAILLGANILPLKPVETVEHLETNGAGALVWPPIDVPPLT